MTTERTSGQQAERMISNEFHVQPNFIASEKRSSSLWNESTDDTKRNREMPNFIFAPHFEQNSYEIHVREGTNKVSNGFSQILNNLFFWNFNPLQKYIIGFNNCCRRLLFNSYW